MVYQLPSTKTDPATERAYREGYCVARGLLPHRGKTDYCNKQQRELWLWRDCIPCTHKSPPPDHPSGYIRV